jgi:hypothetical protein
MIIARQKNCIVIQKTIICETNLTQFAAYAKFKKLP